jgi:hypothetical protein
MDDTLEMISVRELGGYALAARDGDIGTLRELYFDDARWVVRQLVVNAGSWLFEREVLIAPHAVERIEREQRRLVVDLTRQQVRDAPEIDTAKPVSRVQEMQLYDYYGYPYWWIGPELWGIAAYPRAPHGALAHGGALVPPEVRGNAVERELAERLQAEREAADPHLRSSREVSGYAIAASDGTIGHVEDFIVDARDWKIHWLEVDTRNWLPGRHVMVAPRHVQRVDWAQRQVHVTLSREAVRGCPEYVPTERLSKSHLERVQRHFEGWA